MKIPIYNDDPISINDIIKLIHKEGVNGKLDFRKITLTVVEGYGYSPHPYMVIEYPWEKSMYDESEKITLTKEEFCQLVEFLG